MIPTRNSSEILSEISAAYTAYIKIQITATHDIVQKRVMLTKREAVRLIMTLLNEDIFVKEIVIERLKPDEGLHLRLYQKQFLPTKYTLNRMRDYFARKYRRNCPNYKASKFDYESYKRLRGYRPLVAACLASKGSNTREVK